MSCFGSDAPRLASDSGYFESQSSQLAWLFGGSVWPLERVDPGRAARG